MITIEILERGNPRLFDDTVTYLMQNEAMHCLQIGLLLQLDDPGMIDALWWIAKKSGRVVGVASVTPPHNLILSIMASDGAVAAIAEYLRNSGNTLPGVIGPKPWSESFATIWSSDQGSRLELDLDLDEFVYSCSDVQFPDVMSGSARFANELDIPWMVNWLEQFYVDVGLEEEARLTDRGQTIHKKLRTGGFVLWLDDTGEVVSLAGYGNATPNGIRVGPVYTPKEQRGKGYGVAVSAAVTQHLIDSGRSFVFLFTDANNPVSNHVYARVGYEVAGAFSVYRFQAA
ncbi:MAG: GNAT family N-acetyltransferase [Thermomicrobiales bacterium]